MMAQREAPPESEQSRVGNTDLLLEAISRALLAIVQAIDAYRGRTRPRFVDKRSAGR